jgi:hypothetical protein
MQTDGMLSFSGTALLRATNLKRKSLLKRNLRRKMRMTIEHLIVGATGVGYLVVGVLQWSKGEISNGMIWTGYAFAQVGLWLNIK